MILNSYYTKIEVGDIDNGLSTLILDTYNTNEIYTFVTYYYNIEYLNTQFDLKATSFNTYTKSEVYNKLTLLDISSMLHLINSNGTNTVDVLNTRYTNSEAYNIIYTFYIEVQTGNLLNVKVSISGNSAVQGDLSAWTFRFLDLKVKHNDDDNCLTLTQILPNQSYFNTRTTEAHAHMYFQLKGSSYMIMSTNTGVQFYQDTTINCNLVANQVSTSGDFQ